MNYFQLLHPKNDRKMLLLPCPTSFILLCFPSTDTIEKIKNNLKRKSEFSHSIFLSINLFFFIFFLLFLLFFLVLLVPIEVKLYHSVLFLSRLIIHRVLQPHVVVFGFQVGELLLILGFPLAVFLLFHWLLIGLL